jgi:hypothetical protein
MSVSLSERWQKTALLVFQRWLLCRQKPNVLFVRLAFFSLQVTFPGFARLRTK